MIFPSKLIVASWPYFDLFGMGRELYSLNYSRSVGGRAAIFGVVTLICFIVRQTRPISMIFLSDEKIRGWSRFGLGFASRVHVKIIGLNVIIAIKLASTTIHHVVCIVFDFQPVFKCVHPHILDRVCGFAFSNLLFIGYLMWEKSVSSFFCRLF